jgi:hypothetical protein
MDYKTFCIIGYIFAALGAIVASSLEFGWIENKPPRIFYWAYLIGGIITLKCAKGWLLKNE